MHPPSNSRFAAGFGLFETYYFGKGSWTFQVQRVGTRPGGFGVFERYCSADTQVKILEPVFTNGHADFISTGTGNFSRWHLLFGVSFILTPFHFQLPLP